MKKASIEVSNVCSFNAEELMVMSPILDSRPLGCSQLILSGRVELNPNNHEFRSIGQSESSMEVEDPRSSLLH